MDTGGDKATWGIQPEGEEGWDECCGVCAEGFEEGQQGDHADEAAGEAGFDAQASCAAGSGRRGWL